MMMNATLTLPATIQTPQWVDNNLFPFHHKYRPINGHSMHYVDEGVGEPILFVHGTPTWSFLYRQHINALSNTHRCIAVDHIGFGLSEQPLDNPGTPEFHSENLIEFIESMDLKNITLVVHDFGGPIGLAAAIALPHRIKKIVMFNTWLWETQPNPAAQKVNRILNSRLGRFMYLDLNFSPKVLLKKAYHDKSKLTKQIHRHYLKPFEERDSRYALLRLGLSLVGSSDWYQAQWEKLEVLENKPWLILWGTKDQFITPSFLEKWMQRLPHATVVPLPAGHFVQEEFPDMTLDAIRSFLG
jgi:pimeloyl-ACP methyl ester carboxylesterase